MRRLIYLAVIVIILIQIPFAVSLWRTRALYRYLESLPQVSNPSPPFRDVRGVIHVHSAQGGHSLGTYAEIVRAAKETGCAFVMLTEHTGHPPLLARISDPAVLLIYGQEEERAPSGDTLSAGDGGLRIQSGEDRPISADATALEVFNLHESAQTGDSWFNRISLLYHRAFHPELFFFKLWTVNRSHFNRWDAELPHRMLTGLAGADAHQNLGLRLETASGQEIFSFTADPYRESFRAVSVHVMLGADAPVSEQAVLSALRRGATYFAFEKIASATGFSFHAVQAGKVTGMGSTVSPGATLICQAPRRAVLQVLRNGHLWQAEKGGRLSVTAKDPGVYRAEVYPADPPESLVGKPWIVSNPIFVK